MTGADMDCSAYLGDEDYGIYIDVKETSDGWIAVFTVDGPHFTESLPDLGPFTTRIDAANAGIWHATEIANTNHVEISDDERASALAFLMTE